MLKTGFDHSCMHFFANTPSRTHLCAQGPRLGAGRVTRSVSHRLGWHWASTCGAKARRSDLSVKRLTAGVSITARCKKHQAFASSQSIKCERKSMNKNNRCSVSELLFAHFVHSLHIITMGSDAGTRLEQFDNYFSLKSIKNSIQIPRLIQAHFKSILCHIRLPLKVPHINSELGNIGLPLFPLYYWN